MIEVKNVTFSYYEESETDTKNNEPVPVALENVSLHISEGEFVSIVGRNGSGKSTLAKLLNGLIVPKTGVVTVAGMDTVNDETIFDVRKTVGMVFQNPDNQIIGTTVEEDVAFGPENLGVPTEEMHKIVAEAIETVGLTKFSKTEPHLLSGGQKQRAAIAGVLAMRPKCIVLDESTAMLDPIGRREVMSVIEKLNREEGITVILITHHMDEVAMTGRSILMNDGKISFDGTPRELFSNTKLVHDSGLELPQPAYLMELLGLDTGIISPEEAADKIASMLRGGNHVS